MPVSMRQTDRCPPRRTRRRSHHRVCRKTGPRNESRKVVRHDFSTAPPHYTIVGNVVGTLRVPSAREWRAVSAATIGELETAMHIEVEQKFRAGHTSELLARLERL